MIDLYGRQWTTLSVWDSCRLIINRLKPGLSGEFAVAGLSEFAARRILKFFASLEFRPNFGRFDRTLFHSRGHYSRPQTLTHLTFDNQATWILYRKRCPQSSIRINHQNRVSRKLHGRVWFSRRQLRSLVCWWYGEHKKKKHGSPFPSWKMVFNDRLTTKIKLFSIFCLLGIGGINGGNSGVSLFI